MVFSSIPAYLDPANWQQQSNHQTGNSSASPQLQPSQQLPVPPPVQPHAGSIRPGSMAERARLANVPMPETSLKCPRCESSNTKFCYFNNYSLTQPRHFCKACRRYWTRGGALRSVPVGGGCRRNKRTKSTTSSKSPVSSSDRQTASTSSTSSTTISSNSIIGQPPNITNILGLTPPQIPPLRFLSPLSQLTHDHYSTGDISLNYSGISAPMIGTSEMNFHTGPNLIGGGTGIAVGGGVAALLSGGGIEQWRLQQAQAQQFPFLGGLDSSPGLYQLQASAEPTGFVGETSQQLMRPKLPTSILTQLASVKMEENRELNLSRQLMGIPGNDQWSTAAWTDLTSFSSSSNTTPL